MIQTIQTYKFTVTINHLTDIVTITDNRTGDIIMQSPIANIDIKLYNEIKELKEGIK